MQKLSKLKLVQIATQYEIQPPQGVKVSKIVNLHNDIALALAEKMYELKHQFQVAHRWYRGTK